MITQKHTFSQHSKGLPAGITLYRCQPYALLLIKAEKTTVLPAACSSLRTLQLPVSGRLIRIHSLVMVTYALGLYYFAYVTT